MEKKSRESDGRGDGEIKGYEAEILQVELSVGPILGVKRLRKKEKLRRGKTLQEK